MVPPHLLAAVSLYRTLRGVGPPSPPISCTSRFRSPHIHQPATAVMLFTGKAAGLALLSLGLVARQAAAVENCLDLLSAVGTATGSTTTTVTLEADITCETHIEIATSQNVEITSAATGPHTLTVGSLFAGSTASESMGASSLIVNEGTLTLDGVNFATESLDGNRAIYNSGTLSVVDCEFNLFHDGGFIDEGGAVSGFEQQPLCPFTAVVHCTVCHHSERHVDCTLWSSSCSYSSSPRPSFSVKIRTEHSSPGPT